MTVETHSDVATAMDASRRNLVKYSSTVSKCAGAVVSAAYVLAACAKAW